MLVTVVELPEFQRRAKAVMTEADKTALIAHVAAHPEAGVPLGGGIRKFRFAREGGGKSGGYRVVHLYNPGRGPVFLLTVFAKNEKANLSRAEMGALVDLADRIAAEYGSKR